MRDHKQCIQHPNFWVANKKSVEFAKNKAKKVREQYLLNPKQCLWCNTIIPYEKRLNNIYCSRSCRTTSLNTKREKLVSTCLCGQPTKPGVKYCSTSCRDNTRIEKCLKRAISNETFHNRTWLKNYLIDIRGHACETCSTTHWLSNPIPLELHHKDGKANNNNLDNLQLICPNCHAFTDSHKGKNRGNGRKSLGWPLS